MNKSIDLQKKVREGFAKRLIISLKNNGYTSNKSATGASAKSISKAINCSFTIARKYLAGQVLPENKTIEKLSNWLNVDVWWLLHGNKNCFYNSNFKKDVLKNIFIEAKPILIKNLDEWEYIIQILFKIYDNIADQPDNPLLNNKQAIKNMLQLLLKDVKY